MLSHVRSAITNYSTRSFQVQLLKYHVILGVITLDGFTEAGMYSTV
jgi:hypothetical protein